ncbi:uncharacterized protein [Venturia canescens]|uniref:uncharacterized protein n=1 Tax=Venturia canescens TaxID=32260 RepID=UPI001C9D5B69|nr:uncharacterized protein LOC122415940 [Venturia canescens]
MKTNFSESLCTFPRQLIIESTFNCSHESFAKSNPLQMYAQIHSDLVTLTKKIVQFFSPCIILALLGHLILMASDLYIIAMILSNEESWKLRDNLALAVLSAWFIFHLAETVVLMSITDAIANEANRAGTVVHQLLLSSIADSYVNTGQLLSLGLLHGHLTISLWGLLCMRLSIVHTIFGTVVSYITIMMQFDGIDLQATK